jgi:hypothetical protein
MANLRLYKSQIQLSSQGIIPGEIIFSSLKPLASITKMPKNFFAPIILAHPSPSQLSTYEHNPELMGF